jgi:apolipoprotein N-acyltransferase
MIRDFAQRFIILWGWRRVAAAFGAGALAAAAMQPVLLWPVLFVSFPVLVWLIDGIFLERMARPLAGLHAFALGWAFGFGYFLASLYWIGAAFLVDAQTYAWMMPIALAALPAGMALYWGAAIGLAAFFWGPGLRRLLLLAAMLSFAEWLRGRLFTGFPWNALGYAAEAFDGLAQAAAYIGIWGLTFLVVLLALLPVLWGETEATRAGRLSAIGLFLLAVGLWAAGALRLQAAPDLRAPSVSLRIVQPNIPQSDKWRTENAARIFEDLIALTVAPATEEVQGGMQPTHIVWPESSVPFLIDEAPRALAMVAEALPDGAVLLMGSLRRAAREAEQTNDARVYNSLFAIDGLGRLRAVYDKWHLVPYGEYMPWAEWLEPLGLRRIVTVPGSFAAGAGIRTIAFEGTPPFSPLICYEAIFPGDVAEVGARPEWLLNITNDGWFGMTSGPYQHLAQARFRAIEEGLPMVRAANTGISAVIDAHGRVLERLPLGRRGVIDAALPAAIPPTLYSQFGDLAFFLLLAMAVLAVLIPQPAPRPSAVG